MLEKIFFDKRGRVGVSYFPPREYPGKKKEREVWDNPALGVKLAKTAWTRGLKSRAHSTPPVYSNQVNILADLLAPVQAVLASCLKATSRRAFHRPIARPGWTRKRTGKCAATGHLRAPSSHLSCKVSALVSIVTFSFSKGVMREKGVRLLEIEKKLGVCLQR